MMTRRMAAWAALFVAGTLLVMTGLLAVRKSWSQDLPVVDVAIVLAIDVSGSISEENWKFQRDGIAEVIGSPAFAAAITSGQIGRVAIAVMQWGTMPRVALSWRVVQTAAEARDLAGAVAVLRRLESGGTCMGAAIKGATAELGVWEDLAVRRVIDVSGDGASNCGLEVAAPRLVAIELGITINGLPIVTASEPKVDQWYAENVIGGPGHFMVVAEGYRDFAEAFAKKMTTEIAARP